MNGLDFSPLAPYAGLLPEALKITLEIGLAGFILALAIAVAVGTLRSRKLPKAVRFLLSFYVEIFRGTPLLVQLFFVYYGLPSAGSRLRRPYLPWA